MLSKQEFIDQFKHEIAGLVLDGAVADRKGAELGMFARQSMIRIDAVLAKAYERLVAEFKPAPPPPDSGNGTKPPATGASNGRTDQAQDTRGPQARAEGTPQTRR